MNLDLIVRDNLTDMLLKVLNDDGSLNEKIKIEILRQLENELFVYNDHILDDNQFEMFVDLLTSNFLKSFKTKILMSLI